MSNPSAVEGARAPHPSHTVRPFCFPSFSPEGLSPDWALPVAQHVRSAAGANASRRKALRRRTLQVLSRLERDGSLPPAAADDEELRQLLVATIVAILNSQLGPADTDAGDGTRPPGQPPQPIPDYQPDDDRWISIREAARVERIKVTSLASYRKRSTATYVAPDDMSGIGRYGRMWRRRGTPMSWPLYYKPSLKNSQEDFG